jgi:hypothetical protein
LCYLDVCTCAFAAKWEEKVKSWRVRAALWAELLLKAERRDRVNFRNFNNLISPLNPVAPCTMSSQQLEDFKIEGCREKWPRSGSIVGLKLELLPAFESGDLHDCTIRVGCDLQNSQSSFRVRLEQHK